MGISRVSSARQPDSLAEFVQCDALDGVKGPYRERQPAFHFTFLDSRSGPVVHVDSKTVGFFIAGPSLFALVQLYCTPGIATTLTILPTESSQGPDVKPGDPMGAQERVSDQSSSSPVVKSGAPPARKKKTRLNVSFDRI